MGERHPNFPRAEDDWYVEPSWCPEDLFRRVYFHEAFPVHDPCAGRGTVVDAAIEAGLQATGSDKVDRGRGFTIEDFLDTGPRATHIVTNPPYRLGQVLAEHAIETRPRGAIIAFLVQSKFLHSQRRHELMSKASQVILYSKRPSIPPGTFLEEHGEAGRKGGSIDFCWVVWRVGYEGPATVEWSMG